MIRLWSVFRFAALAALVLGCAGAAWAQELVPAKSPDAIIHPSAAPRAESPAAPGAGSGLGAYTFVGALALGAGGIWLARRGRGSGPGGRDLRHLAVEETKSLGNRQYLVVAAYDNQRFLIGVCPGRVEFLTKLEAPATRRDPSAS